jgi:hypothetical protein
MSDSIADKLQAPFTPEEIEWRIGATNNEKTKGMALAYVTNRAIQSRLDELFTPFGWKNEFKPWGDKSQLCGISIKMGEEWITKWDGADNTDFEATKGGLSDAMKRAAVQWGIGRYLYKLDAVWVDIEQRGKSFFIKGDEPPLPVWALPDGYSYPSKAQGSNDDKKQNASSLPAVTQKDIDELYRRAEEKGYDMQSVLRSIKSNYKIDNPLKMTGKQYVQVNSFYTTCKPKAASK